MVARRCIWSGDLDRIGSRSVIRWKRTGNLVVTIFIDMIPTQKRLQEYKSRLQNRKHSAQNNTR